VLEDLGSVRYAGRSDRVGIFDYASKREEDRVGASGTGGAWFGCAHRETKTRPAKASGLRTSHFAARRGVSEGKQRCIAEPCGMQMTGEGGASDRDLEEEFGRDVEAAAEAERGSSRPDRDGLFATFPSPYGLG
jgi:hypothetical protein